MKALNWLLFIALLLAVGEVFYLGNENFKLMHQKAIWQAETEIAEAKLALNTLYWLDYYQTNQETIVRLNQQIAIMDAEFKTGKVINPKINEPTGLNELP